MSDPMMLTVLAVVAVLALAGFAVALGERSRRRRAESALSASTDLLREELAAVRDELDELRRVPVREVPGPESGVADYVITGIGDDPRDDADTYAAAPPATIDGRLFTDLVLRESAVRVGGLAHGVRRALSPEVRNRIQFEMKREVKRSRKERKADERQALREYRARMRAGESA